MDTKKILLPVALIGGAVAIMFISKTASASESSKIGFFGTVTFVDLEGGFWGIIASNGEHYDPINLPTYAQKEGFKAYFTAVPVEGPSTHMWGTLIKILTISNAPVPGEYQPPQTYSCSYPQCEGLTFASLTELQEHMDSVHGTLPPTQYICPLCGEIFSSSADLLQHKQDVHGLPGANV